MTGVFFSNNTFGEAYSKRETTLKENTTRASFIDACRNFAISATTVGELGLDNPQRREINTNLAERLAENTYLKMWTVFEHRPPKRKKKLKVKTKNRKMVMNKWLLEIRDA